MPVINIHKQEIKNKRILLRNQSSFLHKHLEDKTSTEWDGFWVPPLKYIEDAIFKINGAVLSEKHITEINAFPSHTEMTYSLTKNISVKQIYTIPDNKIPSFASVLEIKNISDKLQHIVVDLEVYANIKGITEFSTTNIYTSDYSKVRSSLTVSNIKNNNAITLSALGPINHTKKDINMSTEFRPMNRYKKQMNTDESRYTIFSPGIYKVTLELKESSTVKLPFIFIAGKKKEDNLDILDKMCIDFTKVYNKKILIDKKFTAEHSILNDIQGIKTPLSSINKAFIWSATNLMEFYGKTNLPEKNYYDIWNILWSTIGMTDLGETRHTAHLLKIISNNYSKNHKSLPSRGLENHHISYNSGDINPLYIVAADYLRKYDTEHEKELKAASKKIAKTLKLKDSLVLSNFKESWLYMKKNQSSLIEQSLWTRAIETIDNNKANKMRNAIIHFWNNDKKHMTEYLDNDKLQTINMILPVLFEQVNSKISKDILKTIKTAYTTKYGVSTMSHFHPDYKPANKGKGSVSLLATAWTATAYLRNNFKKDGKDLITILSKDLTDNTIGHFSEFRRPTDSRSNGVSTSVETASMFIHLIDYGIFGIEPDLKEKTINIAPVFMDWKYYERFGKNIGENSLRISIRKEKYNKHDIRSITIEFKKRPDFTIKLKLPEKFTIIHKDKESKTDKLTFQAEIHNKIIIKK